MTAELKALHVIGTSCGANLLACHPSQESIVVSALGTTIVLMNLLDPQQQHFLSAHTENVKCIAVSEHYVASGQHGAARMQVVHAIEFGLIASPGLPGPNYSLGLRPQTEAFSA